MPNRLYPLRFDPIYQYRLWGGRRFENLLAAPMSGTDPIGEAWILSDRDDHPSKVADGAQKGKTIGELIEAVPEALLGRFAGKYKRFPLLLKFLDATEMLSVQVHPTDDQPDLLPPGESGKTEAWIVLEAEPESLIYAGLEPGTTAEDLRHLDKKSAAKHLASFSPKPGDGVFIPAGTVHALGGGVVVFEVQENSDVTFRLYDWDRIDKHTGKARELHVEKALQCIDFNQGPIEPVVPEPDPMPRIRREMLFDCTHFKLWRLKGQAEFKVGVADEPRVIVCSQGGGELKFGARVIPVRQGDVFLLPASLGSLTFVPKGGVTLFEIALPDNH